MEDENKNQDKEKKISKKLRFLAIYICVRFSQEPTTVKLDMSVKEIDPSLLFEAIGNLRKEFAEPQGPFDFTQIQWGAFFDDMTIDQGIIFIE